MTERADRNGAGWTRRRWLAGLSLLGLGALVAGDEPKKASAVSPEEEAIRDKAKKAGLKNVKGSRTPHYVGIGDAPAAHRDKALRLCEALAKTFQKHFAEKGFETELPKQPMTVVVLAGPTSYAKFSGETASDVGGGYYDIEENYLVTWDSNAARTNTFTLVHEAMHQLTYATGLLKRDADVPVAISEGFGTYAETWTQRNPVMGGFNNLRVRVVADAPKADWVPVERLLTRDELFGEEKTEQMAYAEAWLLVHTLLNTNDAALKGALGGYLKTIRKRRDATNRIADARAAFGNLGDLDAALKKAAHF